MMPFYFFASHQFRIYDSVFLICGRQFFPPHFIRQHMREPNEYQLAFERQQYRYQPGYHIGTNSFPGGLRRRCSARTERPRIHAPLQTWGIWLFRFPWRWNHSLTLFRIFLRIISLIVVIPYSSIFCKFSAQISWALLSISWCIGTSQLMYAR